MIPILAALSFFLCLLFFAVFLILFQKLSESLMGRMDAFGQKMEALRGVVDQRLRSVEENNEKRFEMIRRTVDEKLHETLEKRLGESFMQVTRKLEMVHKGLGEMQGLATGVGDLKKILSNVKTRGIMGEIQLENLLEQILTPDQYEKNIVTKKGGSERVEFAIRMPGADSKKGDFVFLPIDAKFPQEDYQRLLDASERGSAAEVEEAAKALEARIKTEARKISDKYIDPPHTTDFAALFLPFEGLYAEVLRRPGLWEYASRECRVVIAGPTTIAALLNSLQMGFRTLAIEKRSGEVWKILGAVKMEFSRFGAILEKTQKKLIEASNTIDDAAQKSRTIERRLRTVQETPVSGSEETLREIEEAEIPGENPKIVL
ncbi:MAG: DNA recombination protein RmuC [Candidatus Omnitrophica bacterium]|nr:DNA recombination protein RmuC [Candidatus Omnitrophota bacterium]